MNVCFILFINDDYYYIFTDGVLNFLSPQYSYTGQLVFKLQLQNSIEGIKL